VGFALGGGVAAGEVEVVVLVPALAFLLDEDLLAFGLVQLRSLV
jgi:hypothetical protein